MNMKNLYYFYIIFIFVIIYIIINYVHIINLYFILISWKLILKTD